MPRPRPPHAARLLAVLALAITAVACADGDTETQETDTAGEESTHAPTAAVDPGGAGAGEMMIDGEPLGATSVACTEEESSFEVVARGDDGEVEVSFPRIDGEVQFDTTPFVELVLYEPDRTLLFEGVVDGVDVTGDASGVSGTAVVEHTVGEAPDRTIELSLTC